ncbi:Transmembrane protein [Dirofilaria immitis]
MSILILGVGPGVIIVTFMWIFSIVSCIICIRIRRTFVAVISLVIEIIITLIIISWPLAAYTMISEKVEVSVDYVSILRFVLAVIEAVILLILCFEYVRYDLTAPIPPISAVLPC